MTASNLSSSPGGRDPKVPGLQIASNRKVLASCLAAIVPFGRATDYTRDTMPQKPAVRAKEKRRLTRRLAAWRAKQAEKTPKEAPKAESKS